MSTPTIGLFLHNRTIATDPVAAAAVAELAEELGYDSLWAGEHVVVPSPRVAPSPMDPDEPILDPVVLLAHLAARTDRIRLGTGVIVLPQRHPLVLAKQLASLDVLCGGRLEVGIGAGYLEPELSAIGVAMDERGTRTDEYLAAMRALWEDEAPAFDGTHVRFAGVDAHPRPVQRPLPVVVGGHAPVALRRAARSAEGWYGFMLSPEDTAARVAGLREAAAGRGRDRPPHVSVTPNRRLDPATVAAYAEAGADRLVVALRPTADLDALRRALDANSPAALGARPRP
ncbi:LLM class F420-dependent oxidoreductase [Pseudonocardia humida]|uniref:LLM class F420-dependent oxidoreductase n=1 Tax=Pseudonocardia humida TaxID=2800819 RepID=A0ABT1A0W1_9PSEU|nr:LLM class F420-dependent oxidoreductase [Pseudonocardia humida]MCO1656638.1 LLM class F420-dependent oxidoreductase [Pseudonocardia humida]